MTGPGAVHEAARLVPLVLLEHREGARVELRVLTAGIERRHAADRERPSPVADVDQQEAQALEERHVVGDRVAVGENPGRVAEVEVDEAGHVIPSSEVQPQDVVPEVEQELLHLVGERVRLDQRHAADPLLGPTARPRYGLERVAPPLRFLRRLRLGDIDGERVAEPLRLHLMGDHRQVEQRGGGERFAGEDPGLGEMEAAHAVPDHGARGLDPHPAAALPVLVGELAVERRDDVADPGHEVRPAVRHRVLEVEHHAGGARVQHLDHQLGVVGRTRHLIALVEAPARQLDAPVSLGGRRGRQVIGELAGVRGRQDLETTSRQRLLARRECEMQRLVEILESLRQISLGCEVAWWAIDGRIDHVSPRL